MKNNLLIIIVVVLIGVVSGVGLLFGVGNAVNVTVSPMNVQLMNVSMNQSKMAEKLTLLEKKYEALEQKLNERPAAAPTPQMPPSEDMNKVYEIPEGKSPIIGKKDAPVTIVKFTDLQCPFCARFYPPVKEAMAAYPDKVRLIIKNFPLPFHPNARPAAKLALAANEQGKYIEMVELLLDNGADYSDAKLQEYAKTLKINGKKLADDFKNKDAQWEEMLAEDEKLVGEVDVRGTPTFFINGQKTNARDVNGWKAAIEKALTK